jgi:large subunit ribosomal protein L29
MAKKEKVFNYHQATHDELNARLIKTQQDLFKVRFRAASAPVKNTMQIRKMRREVARLYTFINQKQVAGKAPVAAGAKAKGK